MNKFIYSIASIVIAASLASVAVVACEAPERSYVQCVPESEED